ncbi:NACHT domain-containing protein [Lentzea sp. NEAU-D13]|uniref:NACHT domain-containing protein n=1 Tax=Lentzea alba TaxID=2714351 RepID=A0A7C9RXX4_9PSEU|nr:NACHT domain-containing protein [Lentzea alba]NGY64806.1 NACHT domain-containing protein [Lentzea alba]
MRRGGALPAVAAIVVAATAAAYFAPLGDFAAANPLPGQRWMREHTGLALLAFAAAGLLAGALAWQRRGPAERSHDGRAVDRDADGYLDDLRQQVHKIWITGFLDCSLERIVPARLGFRERRDAISGPLRKIGDDEGELDVDVVELFAAPETERRLVLLGAPGAGKTTQLLRLAQHLLSEEDGPVPIVVTLSANSWRLDLPELQHVLSAVRTDQEVDEAVRERRRQAYQARVEDVEKVLDATIDWLAWEISELYAVPQRKVEEWLRADHSPVVLLLDGLDEIRDLADRRRCVRVLSLLRTRLNTGMVVCSRTAEYFETRSHLRFGAAAEILPLSPANVDEYLEIAGDELVSLRTACQRNPELATLLNTPLALTVAVLTYQGKDVTDEVVAQLLTNRLDHLWEAYLQEALPRQRSRTGLRTVSHTDEEIVAYLRKLARMMEDVQQDSVAVNSLDLTWVWRIDPLAGRTATWLYLAAAAVAGAGVAAVAWVQADFAMAWISVLVLAGTAFANLLAADHPLPGQDGRSRMDLSDFVDSRWVLDVTAGCSALIIPPVTGLFAGLCVGIVGGAEALPLGVLPGVLAGLTSAVISLPHRAPGERHRSARSAARMTLWVRVLTGAVSLAVSLWLPSLLITFVWDPAWRPTMYFILVASGVGMWLGGFAISLSGWWSHTSAVRAIVASNTLPRDIDGFLAHAEDRVIMRKTVLGHAFLHRTLQSHLASNTAISRTSSA